MVSEAKTNRLNSKKSAIHAVSKHKSTGPRTDRGKSRSSLNAMKHGLRSERPLFPGESSQLYDVFRKSIFALLIPKNLIQADFAERISSALWRLRRSALIEDQLFTYAEKQLLSSPDVDKDTILAQTWLMYDQNFARLRRYQVSIERTLITMLTKYSQFCRVDDRKPDEDTTASVLRLLDTVKFFQQTTANSSRVDLSAILDACTKPDTPDAPAAMEDAPADKPHSVSSQSPGCSVTQAPKAQEAIPQTTLLAQEPPQSASVSIPVSTPVISHNHLADKNLQLAVAAAAPGGVRLVNASESTSLRGCFNTCSVGSKPSEKAGDREPSLLGKEAEAGNSTERVVDAG